MEDDRPLELEPKGALVPPARIPPTAVATATPPAPERRPSRAGRRAARPTLGVLVERAMDLLDALGDTIAERLGVRAQ